MGAEAPPPAPGRGTSRKATRGNPYPSGSLRTAVTSKEVQSMLPEKLYNGPSSPGRPLRDAHFHRCADPLHSATSLPTTSCCFGLLLLAPSSRRASIFRFGGDEIRQLYLNGNCSKESISEYNHIPPAAKPPCLLDVLGDRGTGGENERL